MNEFRPMQRLTPLQNFICTIGNLPTSYALSLSYEEQVYWLCDFLDKKVLPAIETNTEITEETQASFIELKQYVDDYFNNLDVQEEINNKLDEMVESGVLQEIIENYLKPNIVKFHAVAKSSATYICQFANGKNLIVDTGISTQWTDIKNAIDSLGITKFDYMILTHPHSDHIGNIQNLIDTYDFSECICWIGMKPDFINHSNDIDEDESDYINLVGLLRYNGLNPIVPENDSYYTIDEKTKLHFLNTDSEIAENYYGNITEYRNEKKLNYNHFSLVTEILHDKNNIICTGDIEKCVEEAITPYIHKADVITTPHHRCE